MIKIFFALIWALLCLPLAIVVFYIMESIELAKVFSGWIEKLLRE